MSSQPITRAEAIALSVAACFNSTKSWLSNAAVRIGKGTKEAFEFLGKFFSSLGSDLRTNFSRVFASLRQWIHANPRGSAAVAGAFVGAAVVLLIIGVVTLVKWFFCRQNPNPGTGSNPPSSTGAGNVPPSTGAGASAGADNTPPSTGTGASASADNTPPSTGAGASAGADNTPPSTGAGVSAGADNTPPSTGAGASAGADGALPQTEQPSDAAATGTDGSTS